LSYPFNRLTRKQNKTLLALARPNEDNDYDDYDDDDGDDVAQLKS